MNDSVVSHLGKEEGAAACPSERRGFMVVRVILGVLLLAAAGLKLFDPSPDTFSALDLLSSPRWRMAAIEAEALLGLWLVTGAFPRLLWLAAVLCFVLLASVSLYLGIDGQPSCSCFGAKLLVSPWYALGLDLAALASLIWWRPCQRGHTEVPSLAVMRHVLATAAGSGAILAASFGTLAWIYGSPYETLLHVRGEAITIEPSVSQVGDGRAGDQRAITIQLLNHRDRPVEILGGTESCSCIATSDLPVIVPPKESRSITLTIFFTGNPGRFQHSFVLYTDDETQSTITARFVGYVIGTPLP